MVYRFSGKNHHVVGKIGLIYPSDFALACAGEREKRLLSFKIAYKSPEIKPCLTQNWLNKQKNYWNMMPISKVEKAMNMASITTTGYANRTIQ